MWQRCRTFSLVFERKKWVAFACACGREFACLRSVDLASAKAMWHAGELWEVRKSFGLCSIVAVNGGKQENGCLCLVWMQLY